MLALAAWRFYIESCCSLELLVVLQFFATFTILYRCACSTTFLGNDFSLDSVDPKPVVLNSHDYSRQHKFVSCS